VAKWARGAYHADGVTTSWLKVKNPDHTQADGRHELFDARRTGSPGGFRARYRLDPGAREGPVDNTAARRVSRCRPAPFPKASRCARLAALGSFRRAFPSPCSMASIEEHRTPGKRKNSSLGAAQPSLGTYGVQRA
jgi:hypothetical protein